MHTFFTFCLGFAFIILYENDFLIKSKTTHFNKINIKIQKN